MKSLSRWAALCLLLPVPAIAGHLTFHEIDLGAGEAFPRDAAHKQRTYFEPSDTCCQDEPGNSSFLRVCTSESGQSLAVRMVQSRPSGRSLYEVTVDNRSILRFRAEAHGNEPPIERLCWLGKDWLVAYRDHLIVNAEDLGQKTGAEGTFYYARVSGEPLFFFRLGGRVEISYGGGPQARAYQKVLYHPPQELALYDIRSNDERVWFYGYRDAHWYFVDATVSTKQ